MRPYVGMYGWMYLVFISNIIIYDEKTEELQTKREEICFNHCKYMFLSGRHEQANRIKCFKRGYFQISNETNLFCPIFPWQQYSLLLFIYL